MECGKATSITSKNKKTIIALYQTKIVVFDEKSIILNSGGHRTMITKKRMNTASDSFNFGYYIFQKKGSWFIDYKNKTERFYDGIELNR